MNIHSDILILMLIKLYVETTDNESIKINSLKNGFQVLLHKLNKKYNQNILFNFEVELEDFVTKYQDFCELSEGSLIVTEDLKEFFNAVIDSHSSLYKLDYEIQEEVYDRIIYNALNISIPLTTIQEYLPLNEEIIRAYLKLGENELNRVENEEDFEKLSESINALYEKMASLDNSTQTKLKMCFDYYNEMILPNEQDPNSMWYTILFKNDAQALYSIAYARIEFLTIIIDPKTDDESEEVLNNFFSEEGEEKIEELPFFLIHILLTINNYLRVNPGSKAKEALLIKKYLLIACPELRSVEKYLLQYHTIDGYQIPPLSSKINEESFEFLKNHIINCTCYLAKTYDDLTKPHILANVIIASIFIRTYLELSINDDSKQDIIDLITNSVFYKRTGYEEVTKIVDNIIFNTSPNLFR